MCDCTPNSALYLQGSIDELLCTGESIRSIWISRCVLGQSGVMHAAQRGLVLSSWKSANYLHTVQVHCTEQNTKFCVPVQQKYTEHSTVHCA
jgi:hypothetical protein